MIKYNLYVGNQKIDFSLIGLDNFYKLTDLDLFTSRFKSAEELKKYLGDVKLIDKDNNYKVYIEYSYKFLRTLTPLYEEHKKFISPIDSESSYYRIRHS